MANCPAVAELHEHRHEPGSEERGGRFPAWVGTRKGLLVLR